MKNDYITKSFKIFLKENNNIYLSLKQWIYEYIKNNHEGFNSYDDAIEYLDYFFNYFEKLPNELILYRMLYLENINNLNKNEIGLHFTNNKITFNKNFIQKMGFSLDDINNVYIIKIKTNKKELDLETTLINRLNYPDENEFTLNKNSKYSIILIKKINI